jgi:Ca2+-binding EF-hand superfamily protein
MKKTVLTLGLLTLGLMATDFASMTTEELIDLRGTVSVDEQADYRTEMLSRVDSMSSDELSALRASRQANPVGIGQGARNSANQPKLIDFDSDGDGVISEAEFDTARTDRLAEQSADGRLLVNADDAPNFATIDTNGDGVIDSTELTTHQTTQMATNIQQRGANQASHQRGVNQGIQQHLRDGSGAGSMQQGQRQGGGQGMGRNR